MTQPGAHYRALIDFRLDSEAAVERLAFDSFETIIAAYDIDDVLPCLNQVEDACKQGQTAVGFLAYEAAAAFDPALVAHAPKEGLPLLWFGLTDEACAAIAPGSGTEFTASRFVPAWSFDDYLSRFETIKRHIHDGDTYQINLTYPLTSDISGSLLGCYEKLRNAQHSDYCGFLEGPDFSIISVSPELFFERRGNRVRTRPMKGTRKRGRDSAEDTALAEGLKASEKDRAENVMIVDMLRNDLGRIAKVGTVRVPELFAIEKYPTVWQMTSTVEAEVEDSTSLADIFKGLFPCGSVTGAPKVKTMEIIRDLECVPRGVYCGAFGVVFPGGDCVFNVPIRTMTVQNGIAEYPVGSGLVADSVARSEYDECLVKARVLDRGLAEYRLLETLLWEPGGYVLLDGHINRLSNSAELLGFELNRQVVLDALGSAVSGATEPMRVRLLVSSDGTPEVQAVPSSQFNKPVLTVKLADEPVDIENRFLYHKTTRRDVYDRERERLGDADDALLFNNRGELTESTIANLAVMLNGVWYTPPVSCGLLSGVMREKLLSDGEIVERVLTKEDLNRAEGIRLMNSVRGFWDVRLLKSEG